MTDMVNHPPHYQTDSGLEAIDVIEAFFRHNYNLGQVFKYIARYGKKNDALEDLKKARWYLDKEIEWLEAETPSESSGTLVDFIAPPEFEEGDRVVCFGDTDVHNINGIGTVTAVDTEDTSSGLTVGVRLDNGPGLGWLFWYRPDQLEAIE